MKLIKINTIDELSEIPIGDWLYDTKLVKRRKLGRHLDDDKEMVPRGFCQLSINDWKDYHTAYRILYLRTIDGYEWDGFEPGRYYHAIFENKEEKAMSNGGICIERFDSSEGNVFKYVFTREDFVLEAVLYKYKDFYDRTVICCSTMSGCPVGCTFCGTGKKFVKNIKAAMIVMQIRHILKDMNIEDINHKGKRFQIMFMSMGEPFLNYYNVKEAILELHELYPNAELLISTIAPKSDSEFADFIKLSKTIPNIGLQFSIHKSNDIERDKLIPYKNKYNLKEIRDYGLLWWKETGCHPYLNYCIDDTNNTPQDCIRLQSLFSPMVFNFTFSVVCSSDENMKDAGFKNLDAIRDFEKRFIESGYNTRVFDPDGQDDIGGGCGQLWYVQKWMKEHEY